MKTVKINQGLNDFAEPEENEKYKIVNVSDTTQKGFKGVTIEFKPTVETEKTAKVKYQVTAWLGQNDNVGTRSKLGSFIQAFADFFNDTAKSTQEALSQAQDTDNWKGHTVKFIEWKNKNREIKVLS